MLIQDVIKVTLDTNILIRGLIAKKRNKESASYKILRQIESNKFRVMTNSRIIAEYREKLNSLASTGKINKSDADHYLKIILSKQIIGRVSINSIIDIQEDPSDNIYFQSDNCLKADYLITENTKHFNNTIKEDIKKLNLKLRIVSSKEFLKLIKNHNKENKNHNKK